MRNEPASLAHELSWALLLLSVVLSMSLSGTTLSFLGVPYELTGGAMVAKIHPASYCLCLAFALGLMAHGNPLVTAAGLMRRQPLVATYLAGMVFAGLWTIWRHGTSGAAFFFDTLWMPGLAVLTVSLQPRHRHRQLLAVMLTVLVVNALIALVESGRGEALIPPYTRFDDRVREDHFRASALLGHPLANALISASLMPAVLMLPIRLAYRALALGVLALSMLAFGGRSALAAGLVIYPAALAIAVARGALAGAYDYRQWVGGLLATTLGILAVAGLVAVTGLGERVFANLAWDNSANVRLQVWDALDRLDVTDWWIGVSPARVNEIAASIGLDPRYEAIENFWIGIQLQIGLLGFLPFMLGLLCGVAHLWRMTTVPMRLGIVVFFIAGSGANTLSSKTAALLLLFVTAQCVGAFRPQPAARAARLDRPWPAPARHRMT